MVTVKIYTHTGILYRVKLEEISMTVELEQWLHCWLKIGKLNKSSKQLVNDSVALWFTLRLDF